MEAGIKSTTTTRRLQMIIELGNVSVETKDVHPLGAHDDSGYSFI
jgi:hypothetical protein